MKYPKETVLDAYVEYQRYLFKGVCMSQTSGYRIYDAYKNFRHVLDNCEEQISMIDLIDATTSKLGYHEVTEDISNDNIDDEYIDVAYSGMAWVLESIAPDQMARTRASGRRSKFRQAIENLEREMARQKEKYLFR